MSATATRDTKSKKTQPPTKPGIVDLALASDAPVKKAPEKAPEPKESENEAEEKSGRAIVPRKPSAEFMNYFLTGLKKGRAMPTKFAGKAALGGAAVGAPLGYLAGKTDEEPDEKPVEADAAKPDLLSQLGTSLGQLGSAEMSGIGSLLGKIGLPGAESKMQEWSSHPDIPKYVGGGTTVLGTILAAMLARKLMGAGGGQEVEAGLRVPKMHKAAYMAGLVLGARKLAAMGAPAAPLYNTQTEIVPTRTGAKSSNRREHFDAVERLTRPAMRYR